MDIRRDLFVSWLTSKGLSDRSINEYSNYFDKFISFSSSTFDQEKVSLFLSQKGKMNKPCRAFVSNLKTFLIQHGNNLNLSDSQILEVNSVNIPKITGRSKSRELNVIPLVYIPLIEEVLPTERHKLQMLFSFYCGLRLDELFKVRRQDINFTDWENNNRVGFGELRVIGKGDKERTIPIPNFLMLRTTKYIEYYENKKFFYKDYIFVDTNSKAGLPSRMAIWRNELFNAGLSSGFTKRDSTGNIIKKTRVHPHKLRHSYASYLRGKGLDLKEIQELLGHSDISTTQIYLHVDKKALKSKVEEAFNNG